MKKYFYFNNISGISKELSEEHYFRMLDTVAFRVVLERRNLRILLGGPQGEFVIFERNFLSNREVRS